MFAHHRRGGLIVGLCGGYQMLGRSISDPLGLEGEPSDVAGLGLLDVETLLSPGKRLRAVRGAALGAAIDGYEMGSEGHTSELQSLMRHSYSVFCLKNKHNSLR